MNQYKFVLFLLPVLLTSCSSAEVKDTLGLRKSTPDEFNVVSNPPLYVPPEFKLFNPDASQQDHALILDIPAHDTQAATIDQADHLFLNSLENKGVPGQIKKMIDDEHLSIKIKNKNQGIIRKTVSKLNTSQDDKYVDPVKERARILNNQKTGKPLNEGETPTKSQSTIDKLFN